MSPAYMLDADICIHVIRARSQALLDAFRRAADRVAVSTIVQTELMVGVHKALLSERAIERVEGLLARVTVLPFDAAAADHAARIRAGLEQQGLKIGAYDGLIAGHARSLGLTLITSNRREFSRVPGLLHEDWVAPLQGFHE